MSDSNNESYRPGEQVPVSGIYECDCGQSHQTSTDIQGHTFPPLPGECSGSTWTLKTAAHPD
jgi:hypothetical protein